MKKNILFNTVGLILLLASVLLCIWFIHTYGVNVPVWDEWNFISVVLAKFYSGTLQLNDFINVQGNEHKVFVPFAIMLVTSVISNFNCIANMYIGLTFMLLTEAILIALIWPSTSSWRYRILMLVPLGFMMCSLRQRENLLMGMQICFFATGFFSVLTIFFLNKIKDNRRNYLFAVVSAICATYSGANGILVWPLGFLQLLFALRLSNEVSITHKKFTWIWLILLLCAIPLYCWHCNFLPEFYGHFQLAFLFSHSLEAYQFFLALMGNPFSDKSSIAIAAGLLYLLILSLQLYLLLRYSKDREFLVIPIILILFGILTNVMIFFGRVGMGIDQALVSRYATFGNIGFAGFYAICLMSVPKHNIFNKSILVIVCTLAMLSLCVSTVDALNYAKVQRNDRLKLQAILSSYSSRKEEELSLLFADVSLVKRLANILEQNHLSIFVKKLEN